MTNINIAAAHPAASTNHGGGANHAQSTLPTDREIANGVRALWNLTSADAIITPAFSLRADEHVSIGINKRWPAEDWLVSLCLKLALCDRDQLVIVASIVAGIEPSTHEAAAKEAAKVREAWGLTGCTSTVDLGFFLGRRDDANLNEPFHGAYGLEADDWLVSLGSWVIDARRDQLEALARRMPKLVAIAPSALVEGA